MTASRRQRWTWVRSLTLLPGAIAPLLPSVTCPACLAAYTGVLSAFGVVLSERVLAPLIIAFLVVGVLSVAPRGMQQFATLTRARVRNPFGASNPGRLGLPEDPRVV